MQRSRPFFVLSYRSARSASWSTVVLIIRAECKTQYESNNCNVSLLLMADFLYSKCILENANFLPFFKFFFLY